MRTGLCILVVASFLTAAPADPPHDAAACLHAAGPAYTIALAVNPAVLQADFNGDGLPDAAIVVDRDGRQGIAVCMGGKPVVIGAGNAFNGMKHFDFTSWQIHRKIRRVARSFAGRRPPVLSGDAFLLEWESASAIVYWNSGKFVWYQQGD